MSGHPGRVRAAAGAGAGGDALAAVDAALTSVTAGLAGIDPDLVVLFLGADHAGRADDIAARITERLAPRHLVGTTAVGVVAGGQELERADAVALWAAVLPGAVLTPLRYPPPAVGGAGDDLGPGASPAQWPAIPDDAAGVVLLADPFSFPLEAFLAWVAQARPGLPVVGGLASGAMVPGGNRLLLDDEVVGSGAVAVAIGGRVRLRTMVSQGCRPVGTSYTVTRAERNVLQELGGELPVDRLRELYAEADETDRQLLRRGLHVGTVIDEYADEHHRGDFLVRGVLGAQPGTGAVVVGELLEVGQTVQFHVRDARSADEDLRALLEAFAEEGQVEAALLFTCNGRGSRLFSEPDHDAGMVAEVLGDVPMAGFFCAGEVGPVGGRSFLHGFTASLLGISAVDEAGE